MVIATKSFPASLEGKKVGIVVDPVGTVGRGWGRPGGRVPTVRPVAPMLRSHRSSPVNGLSGLVLACPWRGAQTQPRRPRSPSSRRRIAVDHRRHAQSPGGDPEAGASGGRPPAAETPHEHRPAHPDHWRGHAARSPQHRATRPPRLDPATSRDASAPAEELEERLVNPPRVAPQHAPWSRLDRTRRSADRVRAPQSADWAAHGLFRDRWARCD